MVITPIVKLAGYSFPFSFSLSFNFSSLVCLQVYAYLRWCVYVVYGKAWFYLPTLLITDTRSPCRIFALHAALRWWQQRRQKLCLHQVEGQTLTLNRLCRPVIA